MRRKVKFLMLLLAGMPLIAYGVYNGIVNYRGQLIDCGYLLNRYAHGGVPNLKENERVKICCRVLRGMFANGIHNNLLLTHLRVCRDLGR